MVVLSICRTYEGTHIRDNSLCLVIPSYRKMKDNSRCSSRTLCGCDSGIQFRSPCGATGIGCKSCGLKKMVVVS